MSFNKELYTVCILIYSDVEVSGVGTNITCPNRGTGRPQPVNYRFSNMMCTINSHICFVEYVEACWV